MRYKHNFVLRLEDNNSSHKILIDLRFTRGCVIRTNKMQLQARPIL